MCVIFLGLQTDFFLREEIIRAKHGNEKDQTQPDPNTWKRTFSPRKGKQSKSASFLYGWFLSCEERNSHAKRVLFHYYPALMNGPLKCSRRSALLNNIPGPEERLTLAPRSGTFFGFLRGSTCLCHGDLTILKVILSAVEI